MACEACKDGIVPPFDFTMAFHPIVDLENRSIWGYEALVRGINGEGAGQILSQVDDTNRYKFDQSCRIKAIELASRLFPKDNPPILSINFLPNAVYEPAACIQASLKAADKHGFPSERLMFEFTEQEQITDIAHLQKIITEYKKRKLITAIDDFGAGYSGLALLTEFKPDLIKLDMRLIRDIDNDDTRKAIVAGTIATARSLGITLLAEGIETLNEMMTLREMGISLFQGYLFAFPKIEQLPKVNWPMPVVRDASGAPASAVA
jgi:EAL domain-containing protein (putative c-di-GMP-specific phosphodiesterase class I)